MRKNIKLTIAYDGTSLYGWQKTQEGDSVEGLLEGVLRQILSENTLLQAASRTDRGVHARGQVVNFFTEKEVEREALKKSLNALLEGAIRVLDVEEAGPSFHPTLDAKGKEYRYHLTYGEHQDPMRRFYAWHLSTTLDLEKMREGARIFLGTHDFSAFCNQRKNLNYPDKTRTITRLDILELGEDEIVITIAGNHFLYKMVRNIVGTLVDVGLGKMAPEEIKKILLLRSRPLAGQTAPAQGLFLTKIFYSLEDHDGKK